jgi:hypothetical protein
MPINRTTVTSMLLFAVSFSALTGCANAPPPAPVVAAAYQPNFAYARASQGNKLDVTLGVVAPSFGETEGKAYLSANRDDDVTKAMLSAMKATFSEVLVAKGFSVTGPFDSIDDMTFPQKKVADLLIYPVFDFSVAFRAVNAHQEQPASQPFSLPIFGGSANKNPAPSAPWVCDVAINVEGNISFVAQEPQSAQRMWVKRLEVTSSKEALPNQHGSICNHNGQEPWSQEAKNAWARAHELVYQQSMKAFDNYVNGEEFQQLKRQSQELRTKKVY